MFFGRTEYIPEVVIPTKCQGTWGVCLWDENDEQGDFRWAAFETGIAQEQWKAKWIWPELTEIPRFLTAQDPLNRASYLRKIFHAPKASHARMYITAHGIYDAWINGRHVDGYLLAPGTSQYPRRLQVQTYDVADMLVDGENEIIVSIGDGWWRGCLGWTMKRNTFGRQLTLLCQIEADGQILAATDCTWKASQNGPLGLNDMMQLEQYDANVVIDDWHEVIVKDFKLDNLIGTCLPITAHEQFQAKKLITPKGELVLDFGQNIAGYAQFDVMAKGGEKLLLTFVEVLDKDGNFQSWHNQNPDVPYCVQQVEYTCKPGRNVYHQTKCYYGFRYVKVETDLEITGEEFSHMPLPFVRRQYLRYLDMGADMIVGHHPHVVQNWERVGDKMIFYSLGNFVFDTDYQRKQKYSEYGVLVKVHFTKDSFTWEYQGTCVDRNNNCIIACDPPAIFTEINDRAYRRLWPLGVVNFVQSDHAAGIWLYPQKAKFGMLRWLCNDIGFFGFAHAMEMLWGRILARIGIWKKCDPRLIKYLK